MEHEGSRSQLQVRQQSNREHLTNKDVRKYLLQFILQCKGVVHENMLLSCLLALEYDSGRLRVSDEDEKPNLENWKEKLSDHVTKLNVQLNPLNFRIVKMNHPMGKNYVSRRFKNLIPDLVVANWPETSRYYLYVNTKYEDQMKLATSFTPSEISFVKWCIETILINGNDIMPYETELRTDLIREVDRVYAAKYGADFTGLPTCVVYRSGSGNLMNNEEIPVTKVEDILMRLSENKWLYRSSDGKIGFDIKFLLEMKEYLIDNYEVPVCVTCNDIVLQGVLCGRCKEEHNNGWHVDCLDHHLKHVGENCTSCESPLRHSGTYIIG